MNRLPGRVFMIVWWLNDFGGMERHLVELAIALRRRGIEVRIFSENPVPRGNQYRLRLAHEAIPLWAPILPRWLVNMLREPSRTGVPGAIHKVVCGYMNRRADQATRRTGFETANDPRHGALAAAMRLAMEREAEQGCPDVIHVHGFRLGQPWAVPWALSHRWGVVYTEHSTIGDWGGPHEPDAISVVEAAGVIACVSERSRDSLATLIHGRGIDVHRHIVRGEPDPHGEVRREPLVTLLSIARLRQEKGIDVLLRAVARVRREGHQFRLRIVGGGPDRDALERLSDDLDLNGSVQFLGEQDTAQISAELRRSDIFVLPSRTEALPVALLEAMAAGKAIVATAVGGVPEVLNGAGGLVVARDSVEDLAAALTTVVSDSGRRAQLQSSARQAFYRNGHDEQTVVEHVLDSYRLAISRVPS
nr:D-inositol 3-phosphate glycosyltransferase [uncultured bacterium]